MRRRSCGSPCRSSGLEWPLLALLRIAGLVVVVVSLALLLWAAGIWIHDQLSSPGRGHTNERPQLLKWRDSANGDWTLEAGYDQKADLCFGLLQVDDRFLVAPTTWNEPLEQQGLMVEYGRLRANVLVRAIYEDATVSKHIVVEIIARDAMSIDVTRASR
jgi:hypothetical protein